MKASTQAVDTCWATVARAKLNHAGHVTVRAVASGQNEPAGQCRFDRRQHVVAIQPKNRFGQMIGADL